MWDSSTSFGISLKIILFNSTLHSVLKCTYDISEFPQSRFFWKSRHFRHCHDISCLHTYYQYCQYIDGYSCCNRGRSIQLALLTQNISWSNFLLEHDKHGDLLVPGPRRAADVKFWRRSFGQSWDFLFKVRYNILISGPQAQARHVLDERYHGNEKNEVFLLLCFVCSAGRITTSYI